MKKNKIIIIDVVLIIAAGIGIYSVVNKKGFKAENMNTLKIYSEEQQGGGEAPILKSIIDEFKIKYPSIKIEKVVFNDPQKYNQKLLSDTLSGGGPDILFFNTNYVNEKTLEKSDVLTDLKPFFKGDSTNYNINVINSGVYKNKLLVLPIDYSVSGYLSTKQLMDKNNIKLDKNMNENNFVEEISSKFLNTSENSKKTIFAYPIKITDFIASSGIDFIDYENKKVHFDKKEFKNIIDNYKKIYNLTPKAESFSGNSGEEGIEALQNGKTLFSDDEAVLSYPLGLLQSQSKIKALTGEDVIMGTIPTYNKGQNEIIAKVEDCMGINKKTSNKEAAYNFIKIALSEKAQKNINSIPVNRTMAENIKSNYSKQFNGKDSIVVSDPGGSEKVTLIKPSNEIEKYYDDVTGNISEAKIIDPTIEKLIMESFKPYFENKKSYDEALKVLQDKVKLYINE